MKLILLAMILSQNPVETEVSIPTGNLILKGTLTAPSQASSGIGVVMISGSGATDRDGNTPSAGVLPNSLKLLAHELAQQGITSLRYDKRGLPSSVGHFDHSQVTMNDFAIDATAAAKVLSEQPGIDRTFLLGHSEGGTLALLAARDGAPHHGVILVAAIGRPFAVVLREQLARSAPANLMAQFDSAWALYIQGDPVDNIHPGLVPLFNPINRRFIQSWAELNAPGLIAGLEAPVLVIQGTTDLQVTDADAEALAATSRHTDLVLLSGMNHVLKADSGTTVAAQLRSYTDPSIALMPGLTKAITDWIKLR